MSYPCVCIISGLPRKYYGHYSFVLCYVYWVQHEDVIIIIVANMIIGVIYVIWIVLVSGNCLWHLILTCWQHWWLLTCGCAKLLGVGLSVGADLNVCLCVGSN